MTTGGKYRWVCCVALVWLVLLLLHLGSCDAALTLRLVQVVHRHGSRSPAVSYNKSQICGEVPCGYLNVPGQIMTVNAGKFLRERYNSDPKAQFFESESYDLDVVTTRSTDVLRTFQSADGVLRGLFPNMTTFYPAIHSVDPDTDWLKGELVPYARTFFHLDSKWRQEVCNPKVDTFIDFDTLQAVAKEVFSEGHCADKETRCACAFDLWDIAAAMSADGRIKKYKLMSDNLDKLRFVGAFLFFTQFSYNVSDEAHKQLGSQGQFLTQEILKNAQEHMLGKSSFKLYHYSGHDTTLSPLAATLGDTTSPGALPLFAQLYAFELLKDDTTNSYSMRVVRGSPGQTPETNYVFALDDFKLKCMDSNGGVYEAVDNTCPYYDFQRFVDSSKAKDPAGLCYLDDYYKSLINCPTQEGETLNKHCVNYRRMCPGWACGTGFTLDPVSLQCKCSSVTCMGIEQGGDSTSADKKDVSAGAAAGIAIATFCVGAIFAGSVAALVMAWRSRTRALEASKPPA